MQSRNSKWKTGPGVLCYLAIVLGLLAGCSSGQKGLPGKNESTIKPNVLFIIVDDLRPDLGVYGHSYARTPNMDGLAGQGVVFQKAYCQEAVCTPSRASFMIGRRPDNTGVLNLYTRFRDKDPEMLTIPEHFKNHGYDTTAFGKIFHSQEPYQDPRSWSEPATLYANDISQGYFLPENQDTMSSEIRPVTGRKKSATEAAKIADERYPDGRIARSAVAWLEERRGYEESNPFFLAVGFHKPHLPFSAPRKYWDLYDRESVGRVANPQAPPDQLDLALVPSLPELRGYQDIPNEGLVSPEKSAELIHGYLACVSFVDAQIGLLLNQLKQMGIYENTIVVLLGDHGFHLGERGYWCKATNYELDARVPLIVKPAGQGYAQGESDTIVELVDLFPTLADLADLPIPALLDGQSLRVELETPNAMRERAAFSQFPRPWEISDWRGQPSIMGYSVRTDRWRFVLWVDFAGKAEIARELYDHQTDPVEMKNLAGNPQFLAVEERHHELLGEKWKSL
ncbi:MAG: sulfatase [Verrucomicrobia bacterium]|nr:sulfatase [Verrucomicrobiota bacterium]MDA1068968.1 sulfatase [Verrucomicrobiota bacterium]